MYRRERDTHFQISKDKIPQSNEAANRTETILQKVAEGAGANTLMVNALLCFLRALL